MTLASCAPEGTAADFKIGVLEQRRAAVTGRRPSAILRGPFPARAPFLAPPASRAAFPARHLLETAFQSNSLGWHGAGARDKKRGAGDNARTSRAARSSAPAHARSAGGSPTGPHPAPERAGAAYPRGPRAGRPGRGKKGLRSRTAALPGSLSVGTGANSRPGGGGRREGNREEAREGRRAWACPALGPRRPGGSENQSPGLRIWGAGEFTTTTGVPNGVLIFAVGAAARLGRTEPRPRLGWLWRGRAARTRRGRLACKSGCAFCSAGWL